MFVPIGGVGEIGMNLYLYGYGPPDDREWLIVDMGITFGGDTEPGIDVILPDITFLEAERPNLKGLLLTHAHEDHFGAVVDLWPRLGGVPVYATPFTASMLKSKLGETGLLQDFPLHVIPLGHRYKIGPFDVELITMSHSIPEPSAVMIKTELGTVLHTGDWKLDEAPLTSPATDTARLKALGEEGVTAMICDSTNAIREGVSASEADVAVVLERLIAEAPKRVAVTTFASNVARIRSVANAARAAGRKLIVVGRAMYRVIEAAQETGYLDPDLPIHEESEFEKIPPRKVVALCTGSQGEARAAMARIAQNEHPNVDLEAGDRVIFSSRTIPGNEKAVGRVQNGLSDLGVEVITDSDAPVHVSGHPRRGELEQLYRWVKPKIAVPMHGEGQASRGPCAARRTARRSGGHPGAKRRHGPARPGACRHHRRRADRPPLPRRRHHHPLRGRAGARAAEAELRRYRIGVAGAVGQGRAARRSGSCAVRDSRHGQERHRLRDHRPRSRHRHHRVDPAAAPEGPGLGQRGRPPRRARRRQSGLGQEAGLLRAPDGGLALKLVDWIARYIRIASLTGHPTQRQLH